MRLESWGGRRGHRRCNTGILPAVSGASRSRPARGQDAHATAGETPALRKQFVTLFCNPQQAALFIADAALHHITAADACELSGNIVNKASHSI